MKMLKLNILWLLLVASTYGSAEMALIVHKSNAAEINEKSAQFIYLGKSKGYSTGEKALPVDLPEGSEKRNEFLKKLIKKSEGQYTAYWAKMLFTGKGTPPKVVAKGEDVVDIVSKNPGAIGYVDASIVNDSVKVVLKF